MADLINRQDAQERQRVAQKRRYTFGNDEFSLEAAYHDCKLVFDGITDADSFQEADTGLILYYANEIIYALHEALEGKGTNVQTNDCISRQAALRTDCFGDGHEGLRAFHSYQDYKKMREYLKSLPSAEPETAKRIVGCSRGGMTMWYQCNMCHEPVDEKDAFCRGCGRRLEDD